ncbi:hypothetical protein CDCA_CDCA13G3596 [Cyanidium caldarium]|uniref:Large ribosomal subunit protein uL24c n=1 Tax=Cyanidium caldarium TaxID=2771 RepID=A0AAV9IZL0_CYACA|nr:hypothetical protein CDCA_CDCA13G3596 [Cyanidium caldarium]
MKFNKRVSSSRRKQRKAHFRAPGHERRIRMAAPLSRELRDKYHVRSMPVRIGDDVLIVRGSRKGSAGKIRQCHRRKYVVYVEGVARDRANKQPADIGISPSNVRIVALNMTADREEFFEHKRRVVRARQRAGDKDEEMVDAD